MQQHITVLASTPLLVPSQWGSLCSLSCHRAVLPGAVCFSFPAPYNHSGGRLG